jgi:putative transcriptional regulator
MPKLSTRNPRAPAKPLAGVGSRLIASLREVHDILAAGRRPQDVLTTRTYDVTPPPEFEPAAVKVLRERLGMSQAVFASLLGASVPLVQGWEQGKRTPNPMARRLLGAVAAQPDRWRAMVSVKTVRSGGALPRPHSSTSISPATASATSHPFSVSRTPAASDASRPTASNRPKASANRSRASRPVRAVKSA